MRVAEARITFVSTDAGEVTGLVVHMNGKDQPGNKVR
jgi:hypothetical protein